MGTGVGRTSYSIMERGHITQILSSTPEDRRMIFDEVVFFQAEDGMRDYKVTGVQTCALPIFGAGIQMSPNAMRVLRALGLEPHLRGIAFQPPSWAHRVWDTGEQLSELSFSDAEAR